MNKVYDQDGITLYHGDARTFTREIICDAVVTGPPYFEHPDAAKEVIANIRPDVLICQWDELSIPPSPLPLVAVHAWAHFLGGRWQAFYHFAKAGTRRQSRVFLHSPITASRTIPHPHQFPFRLAMSLIEMIPVEMTICDPFAGSGSTLLAAQLLGRKAVGIEIEAEYCDLIIRRLSEQRP